MDNVTGDNEQAFALGSLSFYKSSVFLYLLLNFFHYAALSAARPYFSLLARDNQATIIQIGIITSLYSVCQVIFSLPFGRVIDKIGSKMPLFWGSFSFVAGIALLIFVNNLFLISFAILLIGISHVAILLGSQNAISDLPSGVQRGQFVGLYTFANSAGSFLGPMIGGFLQDRLGRNLGFSGSFVLGLLCVFITLAVPQSKAKLAHSEEGSLLSLFRNTELIRLIAVSGIVLFSTEVTLSYFPLYGTDTGLSVVAIGSILSVRGMAQMLVRPFIKSLIKWLRRDRVLIGSLLFGGLGIILMGICHSYWLLMIIAAFTGMTLGLGTPMTLLAVSDSAPAGQSSQALALRVMGNYVGQSLSPLIFGLLSSFLGLAPVFWISGGILAASIKLLPHKFVRQSDRVNRTAD